MLTSWKKFHTSFEAPLPTLTNGAHHHLEGSAKKKKSRKSLTQAEPSSHIPSVLDGIAASFVQPLACNDPSYQERAKSVAQSSKKRRKNYNEKTDASGSDGNVVGSDHDVEPILCITSPHRVVFMGRKDVGMKALDGAGVRLTESKSNSYVTRPGVGSQFFICSGVRSSDANSDVFAGMVSTGAQYDPASNFIYALRNGGAEVAVWSAVHSSVLSGPDDKVSGSMINGISAIRGKDATASAEKNAKKRKSHPQDNGANDHSTSLISTHHLRFPTGKRAVTLTPFRIAEEKNPAAMETVGAAGCCEDGSIWVACYSPKQSAKFELTILDDFPPDNGAENGANLRKTRKSLGRRHGLRVMDSNIIDAARAEGRANLTTGFVLKLQLVMVSEKEGRVDYCEHIIRISNSQELAGHGTNGSKENASSMESRIEKSKQQTILTLKETQLNLAAKINIDGELLSIIHGGKESGWIFTSMNLSAESGAVMNSISSFSLAQHHPSTETQTNDSASVFSFGGLGGNVFAILMKAAGNPAMFSLRIVDVRRKAELSSTSWTEGVVPDNTDLSSKRGPLPKLLQEKKCLAMLTNALDGSIALVTSTQDGKGALDLVCSKFGSKGSSQQKASPGSSLALALRAVASSAPPAADGKTRVTNRSVSGTLSNIITGDSDAAKLQCAMDLAVNAACEKLSGASSNLAAFFVEADGDSKREENGNKNASIPISWSDTYHEGLVMIKEAQMSTIGSTSTEGMKDSIIASKSKSASADSMGSSETRKRYVDLAFKETAAILLSLKKTADATKLKRWMKIARQEATSVLVQTIQSDLISAREDYGFGSKYQGNVFLPLLRACPSGNSKHKCTRTLDVISAMLEHIHDIPEQVLVSILRFILRNVGTDDAVAYYSKKVVSGKATKISRLSKQYKVLASKKAEDGDTQKVADEKKHLGSRLMSEAILDFTSKIITYSKCNHSFLSKAMRDKLNSSGEVETLLITLSKLLQSGRGNGAVSASQDSSNGSVTLTMGAVHWILALTDAHMGTILKISVGGGLVIDRIQSAVRSTMAQSEFANELKEMSENIESATVLAAKLKDEINPTLRETAVLYSTERLAF